jgi:hypothetical protein
MKGKIKKVNQRDFKFKKIKLLTKCILNPNINSSIIEENKSEFNSSLKYRMFNHVLILPKIVVYVNTYLNNLYMFNKYTPKQWIKTFAEILRSSNITKTTQLYYPKFKQSQRDNFFKIIRNYNNANNSDRELNIKELDCIYQLYNNKVITGPQLDNFKQIGTGKAKETEPRKIIEELKREQQKENPKEISNYISNFQKSISNRSPCKNYCKSFRKPNLIFRTNATKVGEEIDLTIVNLSPSEEEINSGEIFETRLRDYLKSKFEDIPNFKYLYTHALLCQTDTTQTLAKLNPLINSCKALNNKISTQFPTKFKLILGGKTKSACGITSRMTNLHKQIINGNCLVTHSPEECNKVKSKGNEFIETIELLHELISSSKSKEIVNNVEIPEELRMNRIEKGWILWDTQIINNEFVLYTFTHHKTMEKKYDRCEIEYPIYIKHGNFKDCDYITSQVDDVIYVNAQEKAELSKQLGWNTRSTIKNV